MFRSLPRIIALTLATTLFIASCGSDNPDSSDDETSTTTTGAPEPSDDDESESGVTTTSSTTTTSSQPDATTTTAGSGTTGPVAEGTVTTEGGLTSNWTLTATASTLCFEADLTHADPAQADGAGSGVSACLDPDGGLDDMETGLSVDVGTVDGEKTIGFLWGRVAPSVITLTIEHTDGTQTPIEILDGPTDVGLFAYVVEIATIPPVQDLDAVSGTQIEGSQPIRDFLRAGPTYPVVTPPTPTTTPDYPVS